MLEASLDATNEGGASGLCVRSQGRAPHIASSAGATRLSTLYTPPATSSTPLAGVTHSLYWRSATTRVSALVAVAAASSGAT